MAGTDFIRSWGLARLRNFPKVNREESSVIWIWVRFVGFQVCFGDFFAESLGRETGHGAMRALAARMSIRTREQQSRDPARPAPRWPFKSGLELPTPPCEGWPQLAPRWMCLWGEVAPRWNQCPPDGECLLHRRALPDLCPPSALQRPVPPPLDAWVLYTCVHTTEGATSPASPEVTGGLTDICVENFKTLRDMIKELRNGKRRDLGWKSQYWKGSILYKLAFTVQRATGVFLLLREGLVKL